MPGEAASSWKRAAVLGAVVVLVFACGGIDDNEIKCEEAVAHLEECCPGIQPRRFRCDEEDTCNNRDPDFFERASDCVLDRNCDELRAQGKCDAFVKIANEPYPGDDQSRIEQEACK